MAMHEPYSTDMGFEDDNGIVIGGKKNMVVTGRIVIFERKSLR